MHCRNACDYISVPVLHMIVPIAQALSSLRNSSR